MTFCHGMNKISDVYAVISFSLNDLCDLTPVYNGGWVSLNTDGADVTDNHPSKQRAESTRTILCWLFLSLTVELFSFYKRSKCHLHSKFVLIACTHGDLWCGYSADRGERCRLVRLSVPWRTKQSYFIPTLARSVVFPLLSQPMKLENFWYL